MSWAPTDPRTLLAGGAVLVASVLGGFAIGTASANGADDASTTTASSTTSAADAAQGDDTADSSTPPPAPQADELVPVFLPVAEGAAPPATTDGAVPVPGSNPDDAPSPAPDEPSPTPSETTDPSADEAAPVLRPADFAQGYEARGEDMPSLDPADTSEGDDPTDADAPGDGDSPASPSDSPTGAADGGEPADGEDDTPTLVDLCAGDEPVEGCDDGVLGTIWFAASVPVAIDDVSAHRVVPSSCATGFTTLADGEASLVVTTNQPVSLAVSWDYGDGGATGSATGATDAGQSAAFDRGERDSVVTCAAVTGPADQPTTRPTVRIEATSPEGGDPAVWEQPLELGDTVVPGEVTRPERPPLRIEWRSDRQIDVWVPVGPDETALAWLVRRDPERPSMRLCHAAENGSLSAPDAIVSPPIGRRALARSPGADHGFTSSLQFGFSASAAGQHDVCVRWQEGPDPAPITERAAVQVRFDELPRVEVLLAGASTEAPNPSTITVGVGCGTRTWSLTDFNSADEIAPHVLCEQTLGGVTGGPVAIAHRLDWGPAPGTTADGVLRMLVTACDPTDLPACTRWYRLPLLGTEGEIRGDLTVGLRPVSVPEVEWRARTGPEQSYGEPDAGPDHPRLDLDSVVLEPDPASPTDTLQLRLRTVDPADVEVQLVVADRRAEGAACAARWPRASASGAQVGANLTFGDLCPGTTYRAVVTLRAPGDPAPSVVYGGDPARHDVPVLPLDAAATTDPLRLEVSATWQVFWGGADAFESPTTRKGIPTSLFLRVGQASTSFSQDYFGEARFELVCGPINDLVPQLAPTVVDAGAMLPVTANARFHHWNDGGTTCPTLADQFTGNPPPPDFNSDTINRSRLRVRELRLDLDTATTLRAGTRAFRTPVTSWDYHFEVTVTVREAPTD